MVVFFKKVGKFKVGDVIVSVFLFFFVILLIENCRVMILLFILFVILFFFLFFILLRFFVLLLMRRRSLMFLLFFDLFVLFRGMKVRGRRGLLRRRLLKRLSKFGFIRYLEGFVFFLGDVFMIIVFLIIWVSLVLWYGMVYVLCDDYFIDYWIWYYVLFFGVFVVLDYILIGNLVIGIVGWLCIVMYIWSDFVLSSGNFRIWKVGCLMVKILWCF